MDCNITVYGKDNCEDTQRVRKFLDARGSCYRYVNLEQDKSAEKTVRDENDGKLRTPLVTVQMGTESRVLRVPGNEAVEDALRDLKPLQHVAS